MGVRYAMPPSKGVRYGGRYGVLRRCAIRTKGGVMGGVIPHSCTRNVCMRYARARPHNACTHAHPTHPPVKRKPPQVRP